MGLEPTNLLIASRFGLMWSRGDGGVGGADQVTSFACRRRVQIGQRGCRLSGCVTSTVTSRRNGAHMETVMCGPVPVSCLAVALLGHRSWVGKLY